MRQSIAKSTTKLLRGGLREGLHLLTIDNGATRVAILPERGMGLWKSMGKRYRDRLELPYFRSRPSAMGTGQRTEWTRMARRI